MHSGPLVPLAMVGIGGLKHRWLVAIGALAMVGFGVVRLAKYAESDVMKGLDSHTEYSNIRLQAISAGFCLSSLPGELLAKANPDTDREPTSGKQENYTFEATGNIQDEDYVQGSIYALFYAMYKNAPKLVSNHGVEYQFTFNTWGIAPSPYPETDPQRHGKAAYAALVTQPPVLEYIKNMPEGQHLKIAEVGCGTGAGANLIASSVHPTCEYLAMDMQEAAIKTCKSIHALPNLECLRIPNGVGVDDGKIPRGSSTLDMVVISETHIADVRIGGLEKAIFAEIWRVLKPGGLFVWGNAIPTRVWLEAGDYLPTAGFELVHSKNHTKGAVIARDEDFDRVELALDGMLSPYHALKLPYYGERCKTVIKLLIANFFRHPGTALYLKMTTGFDSYMHQAWKKAEK